MQPHGIADGVHVAVSVSPDGPAENSAGDEKHENAAKPATLASWGPFQNDSLPGSGPIVIPLGIGAINRSFSLSETLASKGLGNVAVPDPNPKHQSPFEWTAWKKLTVLKSPILAAMISAYAAGIYVMAMGPLMEKWDISATVFNIGITVFVAGFAVTPMMLAPISEIYGRYWVFVGSGIVFFLGTLGCAVTDSFAGMVVSRFITGCGASVYATLTGGAIADVVHKEDRNTPMAAYAMTIMTGTGLGPLVGGVIIDNAGWRWLFYHQLILLAVSTLDIALFLDETRSNVRLRRMCDALNKHFAAADVVNQTPSQPREEGNPAASSPETKPLPVSAGAGAGASAPSITFTAEVEEPQLGLALIRRSFAFPLKLLFTESVVFWFSAWVSFAWAILYMQFGSIGIVFRDAYGFTSTQVGAVYTAVIVGSILSGTYSIFAQPTLQRLWPRRMGTPEGRLLSACFESLFLPIGLFWFGWSAQVRAPWIVPVLAIGACTMGIFSIYLAVFNYLADTYHQYSSSAQAAQSMCRNLLAGVFPLITNLLWRDLTYGEAGSLVGSIGFVLMGVPWLLSFFGERIRARSPFAGNLKVEEEEEEEPGSDEAHC